MAELNPAGGVASAVLLGYGQGIRREVDGDDLCLGQVAGQGDGDTAAAGAYVDDAPRPVGVGPGQGLLYQLFRLRPGDEYGRADQEVQAVEGGVTNQVGDGFVPLCAAYQGGVGGLVGGGQGVLAVPYQVCVVYAQDVCQQQPGI